MVRTGSCGTLNTMKNRTQPPAFVVLFAALATVLMLTIGAGIFSISTKQALLSGGAREAQYSFTAADTGMECALLAQQQGLFTASIPGTVSCADNSVQVVPLGNPGEFEMRLQTSPTVNGVSTCAYVRVTTAAPTRTIVSQGYNLCNNDTPQLTNPRIAERDLRTTFSVGGGTQQGTQGGGNQIQNVQGGGTNYQIPLQTANISPQLLQQYQALLEQQNQSTRGLAGVDPDSGTVCPAGYVRQSTLSSTTSVQTSRTAGSTTGIKTTSADPSTQQLSTGYRVNQVFDPCVPETDCPAGYVRQSLLLSSDTSPVTSDTAQIGTGKPNDPCVSATGKSTSQAVPSTVIPGDTQTQKTAVGQALQSVADTVQQSFQSVLELFK